MTSYDESWIDSFDPVLPKQSIDKQIKFVSSKELLTSIPSLNVLWNIKVTPKQIDWVNAATVGQDKNDNWHEMRHLLVTGKN